MADTCFVTIKNDTDTGLTVISGSETVQEGPEGYEFLHPFYTPLRILANGGLRLSLQLSSAYDYILCYKLDQAQVGWEINVNNSSSSPGSLKSVKGKVEKCQGESDNNDDAVEVVGEGGDGDGGTVNVTIDGDD